MDWRTIVSVYCVVMIHAGMGWAAFQGGEDGVSQSPYGPSFISERTRPSLLEGKEKETFIRRWVQQVSEQSSSEMPKAAEDQSQPKKACEKSELG
ncbi:MAG: hypothetical protein ACK5PQ_02495 [Alphaproteobacteria bacterium]